MDVWPAKYFEESCVKVSPSLKCDKIVTERWSMWRLSQNLSNTSRLDYTQTHTQHIRVICKVFKWSYFFLSRRVQSDAHRCKYITAFVYNIVSGHSGVWSLMPILLHCCKQSFSLCLILHWSEVAGLKQRVGCYDDDRSAAIRLSNLWQSLQAQTSPHWARSPSQRRETFPMWTLPQDVQSLWLVFTAHEEPVQVLQASTAAAVAAVIHAGDDVHVSCSQHCHHSTSW